MAIPAALPAYLVPPPSCTASLPPLPTWEPSDGASFLRLRSTASRPLTISDSPDEWVAPFAGLLISDEARAREVERRGVQAERLRLALRLRDVACRQWLGRVEGLEGDRRWLEDDRARLAADVQHLRWMVVGTAGGLLLVALVAVAGG